MSDMKNEIYIRSWKNQRTGNTEYSAEIGHIIIDCAAETEAEAREWAEAFVKKAAGKLTPCKAI
jgi:hypothetical protein